MIQLAEEFFETKNDPDQISVTEEVRNRLEKLHPATLSEYNDGKGPVVWILLIPTTTRLMEQFISGEITENDLLELTPLNGSYESIYLCSALVLPEYRGKGLARKVALAAVQAIMKDHPVQSLFFWEFSPGGAGLAAAVAREAGLPLLERKS